MNETQKLERYNQKLRETGSTFKAIKPFKSTPEAYRNQEFVCSEGHEVFGSRANALKGKLRCPSCPSDGHRRRSHEGYEAELLEIESDLYPTEQYAGANIKINHKCIEGHEAAYSPAAVLNMKGCPYCLGHRLNNDTFDKKLKDMTDNISRVGDYINMSTKIAFRCKSCEQTWETMPSNIINNSSGCPYCAAFGFNRGRPAWLYYVKLSDKYKTYYKVGVTNKDPASRFNHTNLSVVILSKEYFIEGRNAEIKEQKILEQYKDYRVSDKGFLPSGGYTELFDRDVLNLDNLN